LAVLKKLYMMHSLKISAYELIERKILQKNFTNKGNQWCNQTQVYNYNIYETINN